VSQKIGDFSFKKTFQGLDSIVEAEFIGEIVQETKLNEDVSQNFSRFSQKYGFQYDNKAKS
jgi:hypothetical protein